MSIHKKDPEQRIGKIIAALRARAGEVKVTPGKGVLERRFAGLVNPNRNIRVTHQEEAAATIDGDNGMGHVIALRSMDLAIALAKQFGVSAVAAGTATISG